MSRTMASTAHADLMIELIDEILRAQGRLRSASRHMNGEGVGNLQMTVLASVRMARQPPTVSQIGRSLGYARQVIQRATDELAERGLVEYVDNPRHKRARRLVVTSEGRAVHDAATRRSREWAQRVTDGVDVTSLRVTVDTLRVVRSRIEADVRREADSDHAQAS